MIRLCFDYGHGGEDSGAFYKGRKESKDVLKLGMDVAKYVRGFNILVDETRVADEALSLDKRVSFEKRNKYDYFISFHRNAYMKEVARGCEVYTYLTCKDKTRHMACDIQKGLVNVGFKDRGVKKSNFYVLKNTRSQAILIEVGFIDNSLDNNIFDRYYKDIVISIGDAIVKWAK